MFSQNSVGLWNSWKLHRWSPTLELFGLVLIFCLRCTDALLALQKTKPAFKRFFEPWWRQLRNLSQLFSNLCLQFHEWEMHFGQNSLKWKQKQKYLQLNCRTQREWLFLLVAGSRIGGVTLYFGGWGEIESHHVIEIRACSELFSWSCFEMTRSSTGPVNEYQTHKPSGVDLKFWKGGGVICVDSAVITSTEGVRFLFCACVGGVGGGGGTSLTFVTLLRTCDCGDSSGSPPQPESRIHYLSLPFSFRAFSFFVNDSTLLDKESVRAACSVW